MSNRKRKLHTTYGEAVAIACVLQGLVLCCVNAQTTPPLHMRRDLSHLPKRQSNGSVSITVWNNCSETIWPGVGTQHGTIPAITGFELESGSSKVVSVDPEWQGRVWGRTNCTFPNLNAPSKACGTGDCAGALNCTVSVRFLSTW
jgi:hypothetical protein